MQETPNHKIHALIKETFGDHPVFLKTGDFYTTYNADAHTVSGIIGVKIQKIDNDTGTYEMLEIPPDSNGHFDSIKHLRPVMVNDTKDPFNTFRYYGEDKPKQTELWELPDQPIIRPKRRILLLDQFEPNDKFHRLPPTEDFVTSMRYVLINDIAVAEPDEDGEFFKVAAGQGRIWSARILNERLGEESPYWGGIRSNVWPKNTPLDWIRLIENKIREENVLSDLFAYKNLLQSGRTVAEVSRMVGKKQSAVKRTLSLDALVPELRQRLMTGDMSATTALHVARKKWSEKTQQAFTKDCKTRNVSDRIIGKDVMEFLKVHEGRQEFFDSINDDTRSLEELKEENIKETTKQNPGEYTCHDCGGTGLYPTGKGVAGVTSAIVKKNAYNAADESEEPCYHDEVTIVFSFQSPLNSKAPLSMTIYAQDGQKYAKENFHIDAEVK